jgi:hypothetical protein
LQQKRSDAGKVRAAKPLRGFVLMSEARSVPVIVWLKSNVDAPFWRQSFERHLFQGFSRFAEYKTDMSHRGAPQHRPVPKAQLDSDLPKWPIPLQFLTCSVPKSTDHGIAHQNVDLEVFSFWTIRCPLMNATSFRHKAACIPPEVCKHCLVIAR